MAWLPAEFVVSEDGTACAINSYITGLHPTGDADVCVNVVPSRLVPMSPTACHSTLLLSAHCAVCPVRVVETRDPSYAAAPLCHPPGLVQTAQ